MKLSIENLVRSLVRSEIEKIHQEGKLPRIKRNYKNDILDLLSDGPKNISLIRLTLATSENNLFDNLRELIEEKKIKKEIMASRAVYSLI